MNPANTTGTLPRLPIQPEREPDDMTSFDLLARNGNSYWLAHHLGQPETSIVSGEPTLVEEPGTSAVGLIYPDLLVTFSAAPSLRGQNPLRHGEAGVTAGLRAGDFLGRDRLQRHRPQSPVKLVARITASTTSSKRRGTGIIPEERTEAVPNTIAINTGG